MAMFSLRNFEPRDYADFGLWHEDRGKPVASLEYLGEGYVVSDENGKAAMGFIYRLDKTMVAGNFISNNRSERKKEAVDFLVESLVKVAKESECTLLVVNTNKPKLIERLAGHDFEVYEEGLTQMGRAV